MKQEESKNTKKINISVRNLVEFICRGGDIDNRSGKLVNDAMLQGGRIHRKIQKAQGDSYQAEVPLKLEMEGDGYVLILEGRADGISYGVFPEDAGTEYVFIDEIKGVYRNLAHLEKPDNVHLAQAKCYAYIYALQNHLEKIGVQMTYCNLDTEEIRRFQQVYEWDELNDWFRNLMGEYRKWADWQVAWKEKRQESIHRLEFPFPYREGQKKLVTDVYRTIQRKKTLFLEAPTGVGKTISTIFPAVKAVGEGLADRIFYLTAKTITAAVAKETFQLLRKNGYQAKIIQITAKEKLCMCEEMECNPQHCPYAKGHYDRVNDAVFDLLQKTDLFTREEIREQAEKYQVCPFEMCLDIATWADNILCDYNYVFDPNVYLKRFFQENVKGDYLFLVDEAHNLVERSREMYSAVLVKEDILAVKKLMKPQSYMIGKTLDKCNKAMLELKRECETYQVLESIGTLAFHLMRLASQLEEFFEKPREFAGKQEVLDFYFLLRKFINIYELVDDHYVIYTQMEKDGHFTLKLFCVDPSVNLQKCIDKGNATIFFSATLLPIRYYKRLLSTSEENYAVYAQSTFRPEQQLLAFGREVSTKYTRRCRTEYEKISEYITTTIQGRTGNYMVFFPSYQMMQDVYEIMDEQMQKESSITIICQKSNMKEPEREAFLEAFEAEREETLVAFCVMGGIFGEGIDLKNDRLIGAVIVGTGIPQISYEREILKNYYDMHGLSGFDYAFRYPGMNKVLQAAGRVIRTTEDKGVIVLLDERFLKSDYRPLFPREWNHHMVCNCTQLEEALRKFWK